jgi:hypothetical protein
MNVIIEFPPLIVHEKTGYQGEVLLRLSRLAFQFAKIDVDAAHGA